MGKWRTILQIQTKEGIVKTDPIPITRGIFQGDSLSPLLFCMALTPLSNMLNQTGLGYKCYGRTINHLLYMDDLKLYAANDEQLETLLQTVYGFTREIDIKFGLEKCAKATLKRGKLIKNTNTILDKETEIRELEQTQTYKYLGINEIDRVQHTQMKEKVRKEYYRRIRLILKTELNAKNKIIGINTLAVPVISYSYNILNWTLSELAKLDRKTRKIMTAFRTHHPKSDVERLYLPRIQGGRGLMQLENYYKISTVGLQKYLEKNKGELMQIATEHEQNKKLFSVYKEANKYRKQTEIADGCEEKGETTTEIVKKLKDKFKTGLQNSMLKRWQEKPLHGQYLKKLNREEIDQEQTQHWLRNAELKAETK